MNLFREWKTTDWSSHVDFTFEPARTALAYGLARTEGLHRWVDAGTLLGIVREGTFIAHDTDIDIAVACTIDEGLAVSFSEQQLVRTIHWAHLPMQYAYFHGGIIVDVYFYYRGIRDGILVNATPQAVITIPEHLVDGPVGQLSWEGLSLPVPRDLDAYLTWTYGQWKVPQTKKVGWTADRPNIHPSSATNEWVLPGHHEETKRHLQHEMNPVTSSS